MDFEALKTRLHEFNALREGDELQEGIVDRIEPEFSDSWPAGIDPRLHIALRNAGHRRPYKHQAQAIELALKGHDVVLESPTASGKTLAFAVPLLNALLLNPDAHALLIYPMNALSFDQAEKFRELAEPLGITVEEYHGGVTDKRKREKIRKNPPRILISSPEYINQPYLGWRNIHWYPNGFLPNLRFLVIDEMHLYHGYFGSNMSLLVRRFFRYLHNLSAFSQLFLATATCANPDQHAKDLTGRDVKLVQARDALRPKRNFLFVKPSISEDEYWKQFRQRIEKTVLGILEHDKRVLIFCPTIRFLSAVFDNCQRELDERKWNKELLAEYHSNLNSEKKEKTQQKIRSGEHQVVLTTNALEVGIDIGGLDGIVLAGFPSSLMSAWQQIGRAGRNWESDAFVLFFASDDPYDRFFASSIGKFLDKPLDKLVVNSENEQLIERHVDSLLDEADYYSLQPKDEEIVGHAFYCAAQTEFERLTDRERSRRRRRQRRGGRNSPQQKLSEMGLRGDKRRSFDLVDEEYVTIWQNVPDIWRFRHAYQDAILTLSGQRYCVIETRTGRKENKVLLEEERRNYRTEALFHPPYININDTYDSREYGEFELSYGEVDITLKFDGWTLIDENSDTAIDKGGDPDYHERDKLHAFWIEFGDTYRNHAGIYSLLQILRVGTWPVVPADRFDTSTHARPDEDRIFICENYSGGIGIAKDIFETWDEALIEGVKVAKRQCCEIGCPDCIKPAKSWDAGSADIDKRAGIALAEQLLAAYHQAT
ncbi:MAG: DEAD/DEAH box helicase [Chloroflexi bacterium]|nr:DEAD/DEAH box helicase [Chloroflexota bacterium]